MGRGPQDADTTPSPEEQQMMAEQTRKAQEEEEQRIKLLKRRGPGALPSPFGGLGAFPREGAAGAGRVIGTLG